MPNPTPLTDAERADLLAGVEGMIHCIISSKGVPAGDRDDLAQTCRLALWTASAAYDPARTPFPGFAGKVIRNALQFAIADAGERFGRMPLVHLPEAAMDAHAARNTHDDADPVADAWGEFRRAMTVVGWADVLAVFHPPTRRLVELVAVDGLTVGQAADHLGFPIKAVRRNLQVAVEQLVRAGMVTPAVVAAAGVSGDDVARWSQVRVRLTEDDIAARRALVAEAGPQMRTKELADLLGCSKVIVGTDRRRLRDAATVAG